MINAIGAYIFALFVLAYIQQRPSLRRGEERLRELPRAAHALLLAVWIVLLLQEYWRLFDGVAPVYLGNVVFAGVNLWVHEAGHFYFSWDGELLHALGGTIFQLGVPGAFVACCLVWRRELLLSHMLMWFGYNCFGVARYVADAAERSINLLGVGTEGHDWGNILGSLGLLAYDDQLGRVAAAVGWIAAGSGIFIYARFLLRPFERGASPGE